MRCFALAEELIKNKNICYFLSNIDNKNIYEKIVKSTIKIQRMSFTPKQDRDIKYLLDFSNSNDVDWVVTDHYDINSGYIQKIKDDGFKVLSIDDTSQTYYSSDLVVNQNVGYERLEFHTDNTTSLLLGPKYVMIRDELLRRDEKKFRKHVEKILITLGGSDNNNLTINILKILKEIINKNIEIIVVFSPLNKINDEFQSKISTLDNSNFRFLFSPKNIADLYIESDLAVSAGGSSCYELAYFGIPNMIITVADNQLNVAKELDKNNVSIYLGRKEELTSRIIEQNILRLINDSSRRKKMVENGMSLIDGKGKQRIIEAMNNFK